MSVSPRIIARIGVSIATSALVLGLSIAPAFAAPTSLQAVPVTKAAETRSVIADSTLWSCGPDGCVTARSDDRPLIACQTLVRQVGAVESFTARGTALDAESLAKCNAKAKGQTATAAR